MYTGMRCAFQVWWLVEGTTLSSALGKHSVCFPMHAHASHLFVFCLTVFSPVVWRVPVPGLKVCNHIVPIMLRRCADLQPPCTPGRHSVHVPFCSS